jgi:hypothetical protein
MTSIAYTMHRNTYPPLHSLLVSGRRICLVWTIHPAAHRMRCSRSGRWDSCQQMDPQVRNGLIALLGSGLHSLRSWIKLRISSPERHELLRANAIFTARVRGISHATFVTFRR